MPQFALEEMTRCVVSNVNVRSELHGEDHVPAVDVALKLTAGSAVVTVSGTTRESPMRGLAGVLTARVVPIYARRAK